MTQRLLFFFTGVLFSFFGQAQQNDRHVLAHAIEKSIDTEMLAPWYPQAVDKKYGGFFSTYTFDWKRSGSQDKMIVTQARHTWVNAKASLLHPETTYFKTSTIHGFKFLKDVMWDKTYGGFYTLVDRKGNVKSDNAEKMAYGNAFAIYALAACYEATGDTAALYLAQKAFRWLEKHSHDPIHKGYYQHLHRNGTPMVRPFGIVSTADLGYKDQNTSIHLLEAFTELYHVWPNEMLRERLAEMLALIRDTITTKKGYMVLFFKPDWTPVTFRDSSRRSIEKHHNLDHVSFGHDVETAYLLLEASHTLGVKHDTTTLNVAKRMMDHALHTGWDKTNGGFYDEGYYFNNTEGLSITRDSKNWWTQAEGLNALLIMADLFPDDEQRYFEKFKMLWNYVDVYLIDHKYGDWYAGGLDKEPHQKTALKGHTWKACYHQFRALSNSVQQLRKNVPEKHD
jgi:mannobiose 2-epimerase